MSKEHIKPLLCLHCLAQSAKLKESFTVYWLVEIGWSMSTRTEPRLQLWLLAEEMMG